MDKRPVGETPEIPVEKIAQRRAVSGVRRARRAPEKPSTPLTESLERLTQDDFGNKGRRKPKRRGFTVTQWIALSLCLAVFLFAAYKVIVDLFDYAEAQKEYSALAELFYHGVGADDTLVKPLPGPTTMDLLTAMETPVEEESSLLPGTPSDSYPIIKARLQKLKALNPDTYGWLYVSGTSIDYPVVQSSSNDYYLRRGFYGNFLNSGSIFADSTCSLPSENRNTVIYGHNMKDGTMFHTLHNLKNRQYFDSAEIRLMTEEGIFVYEVYSVHVPKESDMFFHTSFNDAGWREFLRWTKEDSVFVRQDLELKETDRVITLSTCTNTTTEEPYRFVVHGVLRRIIAS